MQKKIIALAVAALASGAAFAQSNVTIYGVADATFDYAGAAKSTAATRIKNDGRVSSNSSYIGFKGAEALGNGLTAVFQFETAVAVDTGTFASSGRDTYAGLAGGFGTVVAGNLTGPARAMGSAVDVNSGATGVGYQGALFGQTRLGGHTFVDDRFANTVAYISPKFGGVTVVAAWAAVSEQKDTAARMDNGYTLGVNYAEGPIFAGYAYTGIDGRTATATWKIESHRVAGYYKFGNVAQVGLLFDRTDMDTHTSNNRRNVVTLDGKFNVTPAGAVIAGIGRAGKTDGVDNSGATHYFVGYEQALSKRTVLKAVYAGIKNQSAAAYDFYVSPVGSTANPLAAGNDPHTLQLGIRHSF